MEPQQHPRSAGTSQRAVRGRRVRGRRLAVGAAATTALALLTTGLLGPERPAAAVTLTPFADCEELRSWAVDALRPLVGPYGLDGPVAATSSAAGAREATADVAAGSVADAGQDAAAQTSEAVGPGATGTNVQEAGVDEPDLVKTADGLLVTTVGSDLVLVDVSTAQPRALGRVQIPALASQLPWGPAASSPGQEPATGLLPPDLAPAVPMPVPAPPRDVVPYAGTAELLLLDGVVVVLAQGWLPHPSAAGGSTSSGADAARSMPFLPPGAALTVVTVVDVTDPAAPVVRSTTELEGGYVSAREAGGVVRLVTSSRPVLPWAQPSEDLDGEAARERNLEVLEGAEAAAFLPHRVVRDADGTVTSRTPLLGCQDLAHPSAASGVGAITVTTLDVAAADPVVDATGVATDGELVYAATDRLYVATTRGGWTWQGEQDDVSTALHGFDTTSPQTTTYLASGQVDGWLLGRWAMSARDGTLRVATTRGQRWGGGDPTSAPRTDSAVTVLDERDGALVQVGQVAGLGEGEQIRAVRWFDDLAVVVTFRQTDPLYLVDLSEPASPVLRGELKVPGYSAYLHPLGDGLLMGVGQDATEDGRTTGTQVATYDVSDLTAPRQVDVLVERDTWSEVEGDSRAFSYLPDRRVALVPVGGPTGVTVRAVAVADDGTITQVGAQPSAGSSASLVRAVPVSSDRVLALSQTDRGPVLTSLALDALTEQASLPLR